MFQRLFYKSKGFRTGVSVTAQFWSAREFGVQTVIAIELGNGVYYFEVDLIPGKYGWLIFEDGVKTVWNILNLDDNELVLCVNCEYWINNQCHRQPPVVSLVNPGTTGFVAVWPETKSTDGCGEGIWRTD